jgi:hypothetical protein
MHICIMYLCMYICMFVCIMYLCMYACMYVLCIYVCMCVCTYVYMYAYLDTSILLIVALEYSFGLDSTVGTGDGISLSTGEACRESTWILLNVRSCIVLQWLTFVRCSVCSKPQVKLCK